MRLFHRLSRLKSDHCGNFIWGASTETCCQPISNDGLLLRQLRDHNVSIMKFDFNSITNTYAFGVIVVRSKYNMVEGCQENIYRSKCSFVKQSLLKIWVDLHDCLSWVIEDGKLVKF
ncbi:hypothetical protein J1N35_045424 [Gossypium stocksii]|uniref:Uncharacterized protein n=1 Tax=Gossypium stocksii TaxID=47602 RepID=A0A9D3UBC1_9ROSI|nr:hypothetical protein J1N35_045424 [Gossypium stocksii]